MKTYIVTGWHEDEGFFPICTVQAESQHDAAKKLYLEYDAEEEVLFIPGFCIISLVLLDEVSNGVEFVKIARKMKHRQQLRQIALSRFTKEKLGPSNN